MCWCSIACSTAIGVQAQPAGADQHDRLVRRHRHRLADRRIDGDARAGVGRGHRGIERCRDRPDAADAAQSRACRSRRSRTRPGCAPRRCTCCPPPPGTSRRCRSRATETRCGGRRPSRPSRPARASPRGRRFRAPSPAAASRRDPSATSSCRRRCRNSPPRCAGRSGRRRNASPRPAPRCPSAPASAVRFPAAAARSRPRPRRAWLVSCYCVAAQG